MPVLPVHTSRSTERAFTPVPGSCGTSLTFVLSVSCLCSTLPIVPGYPAPSVPPFCALPVFDSAASAERLLSFAPFSTGCVVLRGSSAGRRMGCAVVRMPSLPSPMEQQRASSQIAKTETALVTFSTPDWGSSVLQGHADRRVGRSHKPLSHLPYREKGFTRSHLRGRAQL